MVDIVNLATEQNSRFSFTLFAAEMSARAATLAGLRFVDHNVKPNEKYLYRVHSLVPTTTMTIAFGDAFVATNEIKPLPIPREPLIKFGDQSAMITWDPNQLRDVFTAYQIERSDDDGKTFHSITKFPLTPLTTGSDRTLSIIKYDSIQNDKTYQYRLRGMSPFAEISSPSKIITGRATATLANRAEIVKATVTTARSVMIEWQLQSTELDKKMIGVDVERSAMVDAGYQVINKSNIKPTDKNYEDKQPLATNYYRLATKGANGERLYSHPYLVQLEDSIPPRAPAGLHNAIDTLGVVTLSWDNNTEADLMGYHVYRANFKSAEYSRITVSPLTSAFFQDTIALNNLSTKMYYKVAVVDTRFNTSAFSNVTTVVKPDRVRPVPPAITSTVALSEGIKLCWVRSASTDVAGYAIYKKAEKDLIWSLHQRIMGAADSCYLDETVTSHQAYEYKILAVDSASYRIG